MKERTTLATTVSMSRPSPRGHLRSLGVGLVAVVVFVATFAAPAAASSLFDVSVRGDFKASYVNDLRTVSICGPATTSCGTSTRTRIAWGTGSQGPTHLQFDAVSGAAANNRTFSQQFSLGVLSHKNTTIDITTSNVLEVGLEVSVAVRDFDGSPVLVTGFVPIEFDVLDTVNETCDGGLCPDTVSTVSVPSATFTQRVAGVDYQLQVLGFAGSPSGTPTRVAFVTPEGGTNSAHLIGRVIHDHSPTVDAPNYSLPEGSSIVLTGATASDLERPVTVSWSPATKLTDANTLTPTFTGLDDAVDVLTLTATETANMTGAPRKSSSDTARVTTINVAPVTDLGPDVALDENDTFTRAEIGYSDVGILDTHVATVDYGDGSGPQPLVLTPTGPGTGTFDLEHTYLDDDPSGTPTDDYTVIVTITDDDGGSTAVTMTVTVNNLDPALEAGTSATIDEGQPFSRTITFDDVGPLDTHVVEVDYDDGDGFEVVPVDQVNRSATISHHYADDNPTATPFDNYEIRVRVTDDDTGVVEDTISLSVNDVAPDLEITGPAIDGELYEAPATVELMAPFTDVGVEDTFVCTIDWDETDINGDPVPPETFAGTFSGGSGDCDATHLFDGAGVYTISVMVTDDDTLFDIEQRTIVVYDPGAGFVTGGGYYDSPAGALVDDPTAVGRAHFAFVSMYRKGKAEGNTEFQFQAGDINFHSGDYDWLVVTANGTRAQYKGQGTINGDGNYGFMLTVYDNGEPGSGTDQIRMKIWDRSSGDLVYDNRVGNSDDVDRAGPQIIAHGNIVIHTKGGKQR